MKKRFGKYSTSREKSSPSIKDVFFFGYFTIATLILIFLPVYFSFGGQIHLANSIIIFLKKVVIVLLVCSICLTTKIIFCALFEKISTHTLMAQNMPLTLFCLLTVSILNEILKNAG